MSKYEKHEVIETYTVHRNTMNDDNLPKWLDNMFIHGYVDGLYYGYDKKFFGLVFHSSKVVKVGQTVARDMVTHEIKVLDKHELKFNYRELVKEER